MEDTRTPVVCGGKEYYIQDAMPFNLGDLRVLRKQGIGQRELAALGTEDGDFEHLFQVYLLLLRKLDPEVKESDVEAITLDANALKDAANQAGDDFDPPA